MAYIYLQGSIQLTEEILKGEVQTIEFQGADESGKFIFRTMAAAMQAAKRVTAAAFGGGSAATATTAATV